MKLFFGPLLLPLCGLAQFTSLQETWKADNDLKGATISYCVMSARTGQVISELNSTVSMVPASTLKIFTTGAALEILGPAYTFETRLAYNGAFDAATGTLSGDLVIVGCGDPALGSEKFLRTDVGARWTAALKSKGIKRITGSVVGDASCWERKVPDHWIWGDIGNYYGAPPNGLSYKDNKFQVRFSSGRPGSVAAVTSVTPQYAHQPIVLTSSVTCDGTEDKAIMYGDPSSCYRTIYGSIPANRGEYSIEGSLPDPALLCAEDLRNALLAAGIRCEGGARSNYGIPSPIAGTLDRFRSPALSEIIRQTNIHSNNHFCESLVMAIGRGNHTKGLAAIRDFWREKGLETEGLFLADGSGLARASTCNALLQCQALLQIYRDSSSAEPLRNSLPVAGKQGSMKEMGKGSVLENNLRAKTGYIQRVRAYCGYVTTKKGEDLIFSVMFNHYNCSPRAARLKIEQFLLLLPGL